MQVDPSRILVLDIAGPALQPVEYTPLMLRKPDPRRQLTQTWRFTEDGRLCCGHNNVFVQAKDGFYGVRQGELHTFFYKFKFMLILKESIIPIMYLRPVL